MFLLHLMLLLALVLFWGVKSRLYWQVRRFFHSHFKVDRDLQASVVVYVWTGHWHLSSMQPIFLIQCFALWFFFFFSFSLLRYLLIYHVKNNLDDSSATVSRNTYDQFLFIFLSEIFKSLFTYSILILQNVYGY